MKDEESHRNRCSLGVIQETYPSDDRHVRKVKVAVMRGCEQTFNVRPINLGTRDKLCVCLMNMLVVSKISILGYNEQFLI